MKLDNLDASECCDFRAVCDHENLQNRCYDSYLTCPHYFEAHARMIEEINKKNKEN
jgi:hypothetical protein